MNYSIKPKYHSAIIGWRFCVMENSICVHHYATRREAEKCIADLKRATARPVSLLSDVVVVVREGFNYEHFQRVREAQRMVS